MVVSLRFVRHDANVVLRTEGLPRHRRTRHPPAGTWQAPSDGRFQISPLHRS